MRRLFAQARSLWRGLRPSSAVPREMEEEFRFHLERRREDLVAGGMDPADAARRARLDFGSAERFREEGREARGLRFFDDLSGDLRYAMRSLRRSPGYGAVVVLTLALGIAASTSVFSILEPYLLRDLPFGEAGRLVQVQQVDPLGGSDRFSLPQYRDWTVRSHAFNGLAAYHYDIRNLTGGDLPERVLVGVVTANLFSVLRSPPEVGRTLTAADDGPGGAAVVVLSHGIWTRRFGADPNVVGRKIHIDGVAYSVVGVMPPDFNFPWNEIRMWMPLRGSPDTEPRSDGNEILVGRLKASWTAEKARRELQAIQRELGATYPQADGRFKGVTVRPLREALNFAWEVVRTGFLLLLTAVGAVLLIACVNVAGLTLARTTARTREVGIRVALGAGRRRLAQQLVTESVVLALVAGALSLLLTAGVVSLVGPRLPEDLYRVGTARVDGRVLAFSLALTLLTPLVFGLSPALFALRSDLTSALKDGGQAAGSGRSAMRARRILVVAQMALAVVLITVAGLMTRSFLAIRQVPLGFRAERLLTVEVTPPQRSYPTPEAVASYYDRAIATLKAVPGVRAASAVYPLPLNHENFTRQFAPPEWAGTSQASWPIALESRIAPGYFDAMRIPLLSGRDFTSSDAADAPSVVIVSRLLAERYWPGRSPVGRTILLGEANHAYAATVVGVAGDARYADDLAGAPRPQIYRPVQQDPTRRRFVIAYAGSGPPAALTGAVRHALAGVDPQLPVTIRPMSELVRENEFQWSVASVALSVFGSVALLLAALGLYGVIAYSVAQRRRELGIRAALGASARDLRRLVVGEGLRLSAVGMSTGVVLALPTARLLSSQLFGVAPFDPATLAAALSLFTAVAVAATVRPAARAASVAPQDVLREQ